MVLINGDNSTLTKVDVKETALATCVLVHHLSSMITTRLPPQAIQRSTASALPLCTVGRLSGRVDGVGRFFFSGDRFRRAEAFSTCFSYGI